jgi:hypothetical protein
MQLHSARWALHFVFICCCLAVLVTLDSHAHPIDNSEHVSTHFQSAQCCLLAYLGYIVDCLDRLCGLVVRVPGYTTEMYCVS